MLARTNSFEEENLQKSLVDILLHAFTFYTTKQPWIAFYICSVKNNKRQFKK